jgi:hypothetical protein
MAAYQESRERRLIAQEAARIILEEGVSDYGHAKRKAAQRLGLESGRNLPRNGEVEQAVLDRRRLFDTDADRARDLSRLRTAAQAMRQFAAFSPRLVGALLRGSGHANAPIELHVFSDDVEAVALTLLDAGIPYRADERRLRMRERSMPIPVFSFVAGDAAIDMLVFPYDGLRQAPPSPVDGRPMSRATLAEVVTRLEQAAEDPAQAW